MCTMQWQANARRFQRSLERIAEKYSKSQFLQDAREVDLDNTCVKTLGHYMTQSMKKLDKLESMSYADLREGSLQDLSRDPVLDTICKERSGNFETTSLPEVTQDDATRHTNPLDESQRHYTLLSDQPEAQDEELEVSLHSNGSSLGEGYADMVSQIQNAWRQQHIIEAANSLWRRDRRWRKSALIHRHTNSSYDQRHNKHTGKKELFAKHHHSLKTPVKSVAFTVNETVLPSPGRILTGQKSQYYCSPVRNREAPIVVMDMPAIEKEKSLKKTFTVSEPSFNPSPPRSGYSPKKPLQDLTFEMKSMSLHHMQTASCSVQGSTLHKDISSSPARTSPYKAKVTSMDSFNERSGIYGSPMRKSIFKLHKEIPVSSYAPVASPKSPYMKQSFSKELKRTSSVSNFAPSPSKFAVSRRTLEYPDRRLSSQQWPPQYPDQRLSSQQWPPQLAKPRRQGHELKRNLSFDSSTVPLSGSSNSCKDVDDDFIKVYHKFVCLNKSTSLRSNPCRLCGKNSEASRWHSSSNLAALALSPHRPLLRKRHGDLQCYPLSKRFRDGHEEM